MDGAATRFATLWGEQKKEGVAVALRRRTAKGKGRRAANTSRIREEDPARIELAFLGSKPSVLADIRRVPKGPKRSAVCVGTVFGTVCASHCRGKSRDLLLSQVCARALSGASGATAEGPARGRSISRVVRALRRAAATAGCEGARGHR